MIVASAPPVLVLGAAYLIWWVADQPWIVGQIETMGPLERAQFTGFVVLPIWLLGPVAGGFAWSRLSDGVATRAAVLTGGVVAAIASSLVWGSVAFPSCTYGPTGNPESLVVPSLVVGLALGGLIGAAARITRSEIRAGRPRAAIVLGIAASIAASVVTLMIGLVVLGGQHCNRPPGQ